MDWWSVPAGLNLNQNYLVQIIVSMSEVSREVQQWIVASPPQSWDPQHYWSSVELSWQTTDQNIQRRALNLLQEAWRTIPEDYFKLKESLPKRVWKNKSNNTEPN